MAGACVGSLRPELPSSSGPPVTALGVCAWLAARCWGEVNAQKEGAAAIVTESQLRMLYCPRLSRARLPSGSTRVHSAPQEALASRLPDDVSTPSDPCSEPLCLSPWGKGGAQDTPRQGAGLCTFGGHSPDKLSYSVFDLECPSRAPYTAAVLPARCILKLIIKFNKVFGNSFVLRAALCFSHPLRAHVNNKGRVEGRG